MSGHSHFKTIKNKKELSDKKRGKIFSRLSKIITLAAKDKGGDPETNPSLRLAIDKAKEQNMPKDNIERAVKRGTGELVGENLEEVTFEAYGPGGIAVIIEGITENKNRTLSEIKMALSQNNGKLANEGSVKWMFEKRGCIIIDIKNQDPTTKDDLELIAIEGGAQDTLWQSDIFIIYTKIDNLEGTRKNLLEKGIKIESASLDWVPKEEISINGKDKESCEKLFESLDEVEAIQEIYSNIKENI